MRWLSLAGLVGVLAGAALAADGPASREPRNRPARVELPVGTMAPDFELSRLTIEMDDDGKPVGKVSDEKVMLSSFRGKRPVVLIFSSYT
jgi:hypothetical protein